MQFIGIMDLVCQAARRGFVRFAMHAMSHTCDHHVLFVMSQMVGVVGALDVRCNTWFGDKFEYIHGINMMPFTPITEELLQPDYVAAEYPVLVRGYPSET